MKIVLPLIIYLFLAHKEILITKDVTLNAFKYVFHTVFILSVLLPIKGWRKDCTCHILWLDGC